MPYIKKGARRYSKRSTGRRNMVVRRVARQEARKAVRKEVETKNFYGRLALAGVTYAGTSYPLLNDPASGSWLTQGDARNQYSGDTITPTGLYLHYSATLSASSTPQAYNMLRILIVQVKGGGTPAPANTLNSVGNQQTPLSFIDARYIDTFTVLASKLVTLNAANAIQHNGVMYIPRKKLRKINFLDATASNTTAMVFIAWYTLHLLLQLMFSLVINLDSPFKMLN